MFGGHVTRTWRLAGGYIRWMQKRWLVKRGVSFSRMVGHLRKSRYSSRSFHCSEKNHTPTGRVLLGGAVAFIWERERISNEEIMSCLTEYLQRTSNDLHLSFDIEETSRETETEKKEQIANSLLGPATDNTPALSSIQTGFSFSETSKQVAVTTSNSVAELSNPDPWSLWDYLSWTKSVILPWKSTAVIEDQKEPKLSLSDDQKESLSEDQNQSNVSTNVIELDVDNFMKYSEAKKNKDFDTYSEEQHSRPPLLSLLQRNERCMLSFSSLMLKVLEETAKKKLSNIVQGHRSKQISEGLESISAIMDESSISDLACIGTSLPTHQIAMKSHWNKNWYKYYMELEWNTDTTPAVNPKVSLLELDEKFVFLLDLLQYVSDRTRPLALPFLDYFRDQFLMEDCFRVDPAMKSKFRQKLKAAKEQCDEVLSKVLDHSNEDSFVLNRYKTSSTCHPSFRIDLCCEGLGSRVHGLDNVLVCVLKDGKLTLQTTADIIPKADSLSPSSLDSSSKSESFLADWEFMTEGTHYKVFRKPFRDTGLFQYKVIGQFQDITARNFFEAQVNQEYRKAWDEYAKEMMTIDHDHISGSHLVHWIVKYPFPMSKREYLFVQRSWISDENDVIIILSRSTTHPDFPDSGSHVRVHDYFSDMVIKSHSTIDEFGINFELTYFDNPQTQLPSSCVNWVASSAMPDFMTKIHQAALSRQNLQ